MSGLLLTPVPHEEAERFIAGKPLVSREVFKGLVPELRARAFMISGVEAADTLQRVRERLAGLLKGGQWDDIKQKILADISPFLVTSDEPEEAKRQAKGAVARAELLLRVHGFQSYAASAYRELDEQRDIFTHWKYLSMEDSKVRETHAALNGVVLPHDSPFWRYHYPPWEWGCRCQVVGMMEDEVDELREAEKSKPPETRLVMEGANLKALEEQGKLNRGPSKVLDVRSAVEKGDDDGFAWDPGSLTMDLGKIQERYDAQTWKEWSTWAKATQVPSLGKSVWQWLGGKVDEGGRSDAGLTGSKTAVSDIKAKLPGLLPGDLHALGCAPQGAVLDVQRGSAANSFTLEHSSPGRTANRILKLRDDGAVLVNDYFRIRDSGKGEGFKAFYEQVKTAQRLGIQKIETFAARTLTMNGYYTWPRFGYDAKLDPDQREAVKQELGREVKTVQQVFGLKGGAAWWKEHGDSMDMEFDLRPGSKSMKILEAYAKTKEQQA